MNPAETPTMPKRSNSNSWDGPGFYQWLVESGLSPRVARDYASRCRRVESNLGIRLITATATPEAFKKLMIDIHQFSLKKSPTKVGAYTLTGSLRSAARKFAECFHGKRAMSYPTSHRLCKYE